MRECKKCQKEFDDSFSFCPHCGEKFEEEKISFCPFCGQKIEDNHETVCHNCGKSLQLNTKTDVMTMAMPQDNGEKVKVPIGNLVSVISLLVIVISAIFLLVPFIKISVDNISISYGITYFFEDIKEDFKSEGIDLYNLFKVIPNMASIYSILVSLGMIALLALGITYFILDIKSKKYSKWMLSFAVISFCVYISYYVFIKAFVFMGASTLGIIGLTSTGILYLILAIAGILGSIIAICVSNAKEVDWTNYGIHCVFSVMGILFGMLSFIFISKHLFTFKIDSSALSEYTETIYGNYSNFLEINDTREIGKFIFYLSYPIVLSIAFMMYYLIYPLYSFQTNKMIKIDKFGVTFVSMGLGLLLLILGVIASSRFDARMYNSLIEIIPKGESLYTSISVTNLIMFFVFLFFAGGLSITQTALQNKLAILKKH